MVSKPNLTEKLNVIARSPFELYYEGEAMAVSAGSRIGQFDVLPGHADFFSMLTPGDVTIQTESGDPIVIDSTGGIITVRDNQAYLFLNM